ncbi:MAG: TonB-dependent receptor [Candidatus Solibacter sp.]|nr:TonB-dependent receptor [Candidatus Solibacter sp.]
MGWIFRAIIPVFIASSLFGAEHYGYVRSGKKPIPGATVTASLDKYKLVTTTDENGVYVFSIPDKGAWVFTAEMFGFAPAREELTLVGAASVLDFDLELKAGGMLEIPSVTPAVGFQTVDLKEQPDTPEKIEQQVEAAAAPSGPPSMGGASDANEAFLVNGSLSGGLQSVQQQNFFDQLDKDQSIATKPKKAKGDLAPGEKRAKKAAKKAKKKKSLSDTVSSFGASKEGNQIKGNLLYTFRDGAFDASPYSLTGQPLTKPTYQQSRIGAAAGGPIPGSPQTTFFLNFTAMRSETPYANSDTVPTTAQRTGDFSKPTPAGALVLYDPISHLPLAGNIVPANRIDKIATGLLNYIPQPNFPGALMNYQYTTSVPLNTVDFSAKLNHTLNEKNRFALSIAFQNRSGSQAQLFGFKDSLDGFGWQSDIGWTHNFGPRTINSFHWSFTRNRSNYVPFFAYGANVAAQIGIQGTSQSPLNYGPPNLSFTNYGNMIDGNPVIRRDQSSAIRDSVTLVRKQHSLTFGGEYRRIQSNPITDTYGRGAFVFSGLLTSGFDDNNRLLPGTGYDFADFLFGFPNTAKVRFGSSANYFRSSATNAYVVDDWKILPNLSLNLGLRYEYFSPYVEKFDRIANLDLASGVTGAAVVTPGQTGPYTGVFPRALVDADPKNLSPRAALAWRPTPKRHIVLRAGYSIFYNGSIYGELPGRLASQPPFAQNNTILTSLDYPLRLASGFTRASTKLINNGFVVDRFYKDGYAQTWNLAIEQNLSKTWTLELSYMGTKGTRLDVQRAPNRALPGSPLTAEDRRLIGNAVGFTYETSDGNSVFHAGQARLTRKLSKGLSVQGLYTFAKSIDDASVLGGGSAVVAQNDKNLRAERGLSTFDQRQSFTLGFTEQSPVGKKRPLASPALTGILRSWIMAGNIVAMSGLPFTARVLGNLSDSGGSGNFGASRADATGISVNGGSGYFNKAAFTTPSLGAFGNAGRDTIPGPSRFSMNLSLTRSFHATERHHIEMRIEGTNLTNTAIFSNFGTVLNALNYGLPTVALPMRTLKGTVRYKF